MSNNLAKKNKKGFILYVVCAIAIGLFVLIAGLSRFKSGAVLLLSKTVTQEKMITVARAAINETLAGVKEGLNKTNSPVGGAIFQFWKDKREVNGSTQIWGANFSSSDLPASKDMSKELLGNSGNVSTQAFLFATKQIKGPGNNSYLGTLRIISKVSCDGVENAVKITEQHDIKIVDLSYSFLDKYVLFVKSFCKNINARGKNFVVKGVPGSSGQNYSFVYLGNRNYPTCTEYPNTAKAPVILDMDICSEGQNDKDLLGAYFQNNATFNIVDKAKYEREVLNNDKIDGKFFHTSKTSFETFYKSSFNNPDDFCKVSELLRIYLGLIRTIQNSGLNSDNSVLWYVINDYNQSGANPQRANFFRQMVDEAYPLWQYYHGYTDFLTIYPETTDSFGAKPPFNGLLPYFLYLKDNNPAKRIGGSMPQLFDTDRKTPVYVDGPVYVRFFKVGFIDEVTFTLPLGTGNDPPISFPYFPCKWEETPTTFSGKLVDGGIRDSSYGNAKDAMTKKFMSHPVDWLSINNFYFGSGENKKDKESTVSGGGLGHGVFHYYDNELVSYIYTSVEDFYKDRIIGNEKLLELDGIALISDPNKRPLDLTKVEKYRGKGMIIYENGNCKLGNLINTNNTDYLKIFLKCGRYSVETSSANIRASLIATTNTGNNSSTPESAEGGFYTNKNATNIIGNLIIDNLFDIRDKANFTIQHDPNIYSNDYPVRVSMGTPKTLYVLDYNGRD